MNEPDSASLNEQLVDGSLSPSSTEEVSSASTVLLEKWYQRKYVRVLIVRVLIRILMLGLVFGLIKSGLIPFADLLHGYLDWIDSLEMPLALLVFALCSILFSAFTPGSYAPTVVAGVTFPLYIAFPLSYLCINAAAMLNLVAIRYGLCCQWVKRKMQQRGNTNIGTLDRLFLYHPLRTIILLRLPYLSSGILNYMFSSSPLSVQHQLIGNCIGLLPGAFLFSLLGGQARSLTEILFEGKTDATSIIIFVLVSTFVIISIIGILYLVKKKTTQQATQVAVIVTEDAVTGTNNIKDEGDEKKISLELIGPKNQQATQVAGDAVTGTNDFKDENDEKKLRLKLIDHQNQPV